MMLIKRASGLVLLAMFRLGAANAEAVPDGSLGAAQALRDLHFTVPAEMGQQHGGNLFHSFQFFNIYQNGSGTFTGPAGISNVLTRVTGGERSFINGQLISTIPGADFFFLNPSGVLFGPGASIDVPGSFNVSTADALHFSDGGVFNAHRHMPSVLSSAPPSAYGFLSEDPAGIQIDGSHLEVSQGESISVVGGDLLVRGRADNPGLATIKADGGQINLISVDSSGKVSAGSNVSALDGFPRLGNVMLTDAASIQAGATAGGRILVRGGRLTLENGSSVSAESQGGGEIDIDVSGDLVVAGESSITSSNDSASRGADIRIKADNMRVDDRGTQISAVTTGSGDAGNVDVKVASLDIRNGAQLKSTTQGIGNAGDIRIESDRSVTIENQNARILTIAERGSRGRAGDIDIHAGESLTIRDGRIAATTRGAGNAGDIRLATKTFSIENLNSPFSGLAAGTTQVSQGNGGSISVRAETLRMEGRQALIDVSAQSTGGAGSVKLDIAGEATLSQGSQIRADTRGSEGRSGGDIVIHAGKLKLKGRGEGEEEDETQIRATTNGLEQGGSVYLNVGELELKNRAVISVSTSGKGDGGSIVIGADNVLMQGRGTEISSGTEGDGHSGDIDIKVGTLTIRDGAQITSVTGEQGDAGDINIVAERSVVLENNDAKITAISERRSHGDAGNISIRAGDSVAVKDSRVAATSRGAGDAGDILIVTKALTIETTGESQSNFLGIGAGTTSQSEGNGGSITVAADSLTMRGNQSRIEASSDNEGRVGTIRLDVKGDLMLIGGAQIKADNKREESGGGGDIRITARRLILMGTEQASGSSVDRPQISSVTEGRRKGGVIQIDVDELDLSNGARIIATTQGDGDGGDILINVKNHMAVQWEDSEVSATALFQSRGNAGNIAIKAESLKIADGSIVATTRRFGNGGNLSVDVKHLEIEGLGSTRSGLFAESRWRNGKDAGPAGNISVNTESLRMTGPRARISVEARSSGLKALAGNIDIIATDEVVLQGASISTSSKAGGGNISVRSGRLSLENAEIKADGEAKGSNVRLAADTILLTEGSRINAQVTGGSTSVGGNVDILADVLLILDTQDITGSPAGKAVVARAPKGQGGNITIRADVAIDDGPDRTTLNDVLDASGDTPGVIDILLPVRSITGELTVLPSNYQDASAVLADACGEREGSRQSRFVVAGRRNLPPAPGGYLSASARAPGTQHQGNPSPAPRLIAASSGCCSPATNAADCP